MTIGKSFQTRTQNAALDTIKNLNQWHVCITYDILVKEKCPKVKNHAS